MVDKKFATVASFFIPGLGQAISGDIKRGAIFFIGGIAIWLLLTQLSTIIPFSGFLSLIYGAFSAYDTYNMTDI